jgi:NlpC/P60 family putative phage cell wall peptidase
MMDVDAKRAAVVAEALSWLGTPFHDRAGVKGAGVDCLHLLVRVYAAVGLIENFDPPVYSPQWFQHREEPLFLQGLQRYAHRVEMAHEGDIAMFNFGRHAAHGAIILDHYTMIHASGAAGEVTRAPRALFDDRLHSYWSVFP